MIDMILLAWEKALMRSVLAPQKHEHVISSELDRRNEELFTDAE